jgi:hypothetical protein
MRVLGARADPQDGGFGVPAHSAWTFWGALKAVWWAAVVLAASYPPYTASAGAMMLAHSPADRHANATGLE